MYRYPHSCSAPSILYLLGILAAGLLVWLFNAYRLGKLTRQTIVLFLAGFAILLMAAVLLQLAA